MTALLLPYRVDFVAVIRTKARRKGGQQPFFPLHPTLVLRIRHGSMRRFFARLRVTDHGSQVTVAILPLQICTFVFNHLQDAPPANSSLSTLCIVARGRTLPPLLSELATRHILVGESTALQNPRRRVMSGEVERFYRQLPGPTARLARVVRGRVRWRKAKLRSRRACRWHESSTDPG